jgi:hypothetical protein
MKISLKKVIATMFVFAVVGCAGDQQQEEVVQQEEQGEQGEQVAQQQEDIVQEEIVQEEPEMPAEEEVAAAPDSAIDDSRVVRFAKSSDVKVWSDNSGTNTVANLRQGDTILVVVEGDWAKISEAMWVKTEDLSNKAVAREYKPRTWHSPSH